MSSKRPGRKITKVLAFGPRKRTVLAGVMGGEEILAPVLEQLLERGRVVKIGDRKGTLYALAGWKPERRRARRRRATIILSASPA